MSEPRHTSAEGQDAIDYIRRIGAIEKSSAMVHLSRTSRLVCRELGIPTQMQAAATALVASMEKFRDRFTSGVPR